MGEPHSTPPDHCLVLRGASVNLDTGEVTRGDGRAARLSSTELQLLIHLRDAGSSVRRDVLLAEVFGCSRSTSSRTLDTTVGRLRKKIEVDTRKPDHLLTVQGVGYRFAPLAQEHGLDQAQHDVFDRGMAACERALVGFGAVDGPRAMQGLRGLALVDRGEVGPAHVLVESNEFLSADIVRAAADPHPRWTAPRGSDDRVEGQIRAVFHGALTDDRAVLEPLATGQIAFFVRDAARHQLERLDGVPERAGGMLYARVARRVVAARG